MILIILEKLCYILLLGYFCKLEMVNRNEISGYPSHLYMSLCLLAHYTYLLFQIYLLTNLSNYSNFSMPNIMIQVINIIYEIVYYIAVEL